MLQDPVLILVDFQKDFCRVPPTSEAEQSEFTATLEATAEFLDRYRETRRTPILVRTTHDEHSNSPVWAKKYAGRDRQMPCRTGTDGADFADAVTVESDDIIVTKHRYSAFYGTDLETYLRSNDVSRLLIGGVNTNVCVISTIIDAFNRDYDVTLLEDCTTSNDLGLYRSTLENVEANFGSVCHSDEIEL